MIKGYDIKTIQDGEIRDKKVLIRVDYNISFNREHKISDDLRIRQSLPTLKYLLDRNNKLILVSHLGQPESRDNNLSLAPVAEHLRKLINDKQVLLLDHFDTEQGRRFLAQQKVNEIIILENIRFYPEEKESSIELAKKLAAIADIYVNDAFGVSHRSDSSITKVPKLLPSYAGLLLSREIEAISEVTKNPKKPVLAIIGGAKISTKIAFLAVLLEKVDCLILGGGIANTFLHYEGSRLGSSLVEYDLEDQIKIILNVAKKKKVNIILPTDAIVRSVDNNSMEQLVLIDKVPDKYAVVDIGPQTQAQFGLEIAKANTILWNGPVGLVEEPQFSRGTDFLFYSIAQNDHCYSLVGGGDTIAAISNK